MSSVGSSDGSNRQDEVLRRKREEYQNAEADNSKSHRREIRRLNELHYREIEQLKQDHQKQMEEVYRASRDAISARDHKYQTETEDLRNFYRKQLQQEADESSKREETLRRATGNDLKQRENANEARFQKLSSDYREGLNQREKVYQETLAANREAQAEAIAQNRTKLQNANDKIVSSVKDERNKTVGDLQRNMGEYRQANDSRFKDQELRHLRDQKRSGDNLLRAVQHERDVRQDSEAILREGFQDGTQRMREKFETTQSRERDFNHRSIENAKASANERIDNQVRQLESENEDLKQKNVRNELKVKQQKDGEIRHIKEAWARNVGDLEDQRQRYVQDNNDRNAEDILNIRKGYDKQATESNRFYRGQMEEVNRINRLAHDNLIGDFDARQEHTKMTADSRIKSIYENSEIEKARLTELQQETHEAGQRQQQVELKKLRETLEDEKIEAIRRMEDQMRKQELSHSEKMTSVTQKYEKQISALKDQIIKVQRNGEENLKRTVDELQRAHKVSMDQVESKNRERMRQVSSQQSDEIRSLNKRHEDRLDQVLAEVKKT